MNAVPRAFPGDTIVCLGGGPSLTSEDVDYCRGKAKVIAIKEAIRKAPWADVFYAADKLFFEHHLDELADFRGLRFTLDHFVADHATLLQIGDETGLSLDPTTLNTGKNAGHQAINLAVLLGAAKIVLLGYDMTDRAGCDHWFGSHSWGRRPNYELYRRLMPTLVEPLRKAGVAILNCSRHTVLDCFERVSLAEALA